MTKKLPLVAAIAVALAISGTMYLLRNEPSQQSVTTPTADTGSPDATAAPQTRPQPQQTVTDGQQASGGAYVSYNEDQIANTPGIKLLFFHAPWCPQCRKLDASITAGPIPGSVTIFKVDYDSNQALRQKHGVTIQTTLVRIDDQGNTLQKYVAYDNPTLAAVTQHILQ